MPPKKKTTDSTEAAANGETRFSWTPENDRTLLLLSLGRNIGPADYEKFVSALPAGANFQGVRQRISKLRGEQKKKYEDMGWELTTEAGAKPKAEPKKTAAKRKAESAEREEAGSSDGEEAAAPVKAKKPRAKKGEGKEKGVTSEKVVKEKSDSEEKGEEGIVKEKADIEV